MAQGRARAFRVSAGNSELYNAARICDRVYRACKEVTTESSSKPSAINKEVTTERSSETSAINKEAGAADPHYEALAELTNLAFLMFVHIDIPLQLLERAVPTQQLCPLRSLVLAHSVGNCE